MRLALSLVLGTCWIASGSARAQNLVTDPGFEAGPPHWQLQDQGSAIVASPARSGAKALKLINDFDGTKVPGHNVVQAGGKTIAGGREYAFSVWVRGDDVQGIGDGGKPLAVLRWRDGQGSRLRREMYMWAPYGSYPYRQMTIVAQAPPGAAAFDVAFRSWWDCTGGVTYWDDISLAARDMSHLSGLKRLAVLEAEAASSSAKATPGASEPGYSGSGYLALQGDGAQLQHDGVAVGSGPRVLVLRYAKEAGTRTLELRVNGTSLGQKEATPTGSPQSWATVSWSATLAATNVIRLEQTSPKPGPLIDRLEIYGTVPTRTDSGPSPADTGTPPADAGTPPADGPRPDDGGPTDAAIIDGAPRPDGAQHPDDGAPLSPDGGTGEATATGPDHAGIGEAHALQGSSGCALLPAGHGGSSGVWVLPALLGLLGLLRIRSARGRRACPALR